MIIAMEGPSAVGKTTWLKGFPKMQVLSEETRGFDAAPPEPNSVAAQPYWCDRSAQRWHDLLDIEKRFGRAYADTDPLKLHYAFSLVAIGEGSTEALDEAFRLAHIAMQEGRLGFVDHVVVLQSSPEKLAQRHAADAGRERHNFEVHVRLGAALNAYYETLEQLRPGTVLYVDAAGEVRNTGTRALYRLAPNPHSRFDVRVLDQLRECLDGAMDTLTATTMPEIPVLVKDDSVVEEVDDIEDIDDIDEEE